MAPFTALAITTGMYVVTSMTANTSTGLPYFVVACALLMTGIAHKIFMGAFQRPFCLYTVIEVPQLPASRIMAANTTDTQSSAVFIVALMTGLTIHSNSLKRSSDVTRLAGNRCVQTNQRKVSKVMIEHNIQMPALFVMAVTTLLTLLALVNIYVGMT